MVTCPYAGSHSATIGSISINNSQTCNTIYQFSPQSSPVVKHVSKSNSLQLAIRTCLYTNCGYFPAGFAPPSGMLQPGGYQIPRPQHLYSGVGGNLPTFTPPQLQQSMTQCVRPHSCTTLLLVSKLMVSFLAYLHIMISIKGQLYLFISDHLSEYVPYSNYLEDGMSGEHILSNVRMIIPMFLLN